MTKAASHFLAIVMGVLAAAGSVDAQPMRPMPRIGFLSSLEPEVSLDPFREGLQDRGYIEGRNIAIEARLAIRQPVRLRELANELARGRVDVIVAGGSDATKAAQQATSTIPIIAVSVADPIGSGFVRDLARPEANITGPAGMSADQGSKRIQFIRELLPRATRIVVLTHSRNPSHASIAERLAQSAQQAGLALHTIQVSAAEDLENAFAAMAQVRPHALLVLADNMLFNQRDRIVRLASQQRLPDMYWRREWVDAGGLISVGIDNTALYRRAATYVDRILKGAKPAELPVELPSKFEILINLKTAKALGVEIPRSVLVQVDKIVQ
jgi:putative ABC transport system substrate-binding protein